MGAVDMTHSFLPTATSLRRNAQTLCFATGIAFTPSESLSAEPLQHPLPLLQEQRLQIERIEQIEHQQRLRQLDKPSAPASIKTAPPADVEAECWLVSGVRVAGNQLISQQMLAASIAPLVQACMSEGVINALLKTLTAAYLDEGYLASRAYLAAEPQSGEPLDLLIVEGFVESIELDGPDLPVSLSRAFPGLVGRPLKLNDLEQGLDQLNRLQAFDLTADLEPGALQGGTRVVIRPRSSASRWHLGTTADTLGSESTGRQRLSTSLSLDSPSGQNDFVYLSTHTSLGGGRGYSRGYGAYYNAPYGPWTLSFSLNHSQYLAPLPIGRAVSDGESDFYTLGLERALWRNRQGLLGASVRVNRKQLENRFFAQRLAIQSPTLSSVEAGLNFTWLAGAVWSVYVGGVQGVDWFGADDRQLRTNSPEPLFRKYRASLKHLRQWQTPSSRWRWESELNLQYSPDPLPAVEQFLLSDDSAVRGFRQNLVSGASGAVWRNTLSRPMSAPFLRSLEISPNLGIDMGWSKFDHGRPSQRVLGAQAGIRLRTAEGYLSFDYQRPLKNSSTHRDLEPGYWLVKLALNI